MWKSWLIGKWKQEIREVQYELWIKYGIRKSGLKFADVRAGAIPRSDHKDVS